VTIWSRRLPLLILVADLLATVATWLVWHALGHDGYVAAFAVLVLSTPVGLILAATVPPWMTRRTGRRLGVARIGAGAIDRWEEIRTLVVDPFESLTTGRLVVIDVQPVDADHERNLRWFAGALAHSYDNPVGRAVAALAGQGRLTDVVQEPGLGIRGSVDRHPVRVGQPEWIGFTDDPTPLIGTTIAVDVDQRPLGRIIVADEVRPDAARQLDRLRRVGLTPALASSRRNEETERVAKLSASPAWHAQTDPLPFARELAAGEGFVGLLRSEPDGGGTLVVIDASSREPASGESLGLATPGIDTAVDALTLVVRSRHARRRSHLVAWALLLLALPVAAAGLLAPPLALVTAIATWLVIGVAASSGYRGIRIPAEPDHD